MAKVPRLRKLIIESKSALKDLMKENLREIKGEMIDQIMRKIRNLPPAEQYNAITKIQPVGVRAYREAMLSSMAVIAATSIEMARKEVPKAKKIKLEESVETLKLGDFEDLPPDVQKKLKRQAQIVVDTQMADLDKNLAFQFTHSIDSTDSDALIESDLNDSADEFIDGASVESGSGTIAAQVINEARNAFFTDDNVLEEIEAFEFVNGDPVTEICQELAGQIFPKDDPNFFRYTPPLHFNCKSYIVPVLKLEGRDVESLQPSKKAQDSVQFHELPPCCGHLHDRTEDQAQ